MNLCMVCGAKSPSPVGCRCCRALAGQFKYPATELLPLVTALGDALSAREGSPVYWKLQGQGIVRFLSAGETEVFRLPLDWLRGCGSWGVAKAFLEGVDAGQRIGRADAAAD